MVVVGIICLGHTGTLASLKSECWHSVVGSTVGSKTLSCSQWVNHSTMLWSCHQTPTTVIFVKVC